MKKIVTTFMALVLSFAGFFLPISKTDVSAIGEAIGATVTITNGLNYLVPDTIHFDDIAITSGTEFSYLTTGGAHTLSFAIDFEYELQGYSVASATVNDSAAGVVGPADGQFRISLSELPNGSNYNVNLNIVKAGETKYTIIWANPDVKDDIQDEDMLIKNGFADIVAVYDANGNPVDKSYYIPQGASAALVDGYGHVTIGAGMRVVFQFTPIYGYQLFSVKANNMPLAPQEATNQYTFIMPENHVHFAADFVKTSDIVVSGSEKVSSGSITVGDGVIGAGTAQLSVSDVNLDSTKIADFDKAADGMTISDILDIDFFNVFYKGKDDSDDVWSNQIHELDKEVTITLKLADNIDVSRVVIVHNINDGDEYEIIKIDSYDTAAHTITFRTKSFSNFAIATTMGSPNTGVNTKESPSAALSTLGALFAGAVISACLFVLSRRKA